MEKEINLNFEDIVDVLNTESESAHWYEGRILNAIDFLIGINVGIILSVIRMGI